MSDRVDRGDWESDRVDSVVYVFEEAGQFELPAITLRWWDPQAEDWQQQSFPARQFEVAASGLGPGEKAGQSRSGFARLWLNGLVLLAVLAVMALLGRRLGQPMAKIWEQWLQRDAAQLKKLLKLARQGTAADLYTACRSMLAECSGGQAKTAHARLQPYMLQLQEVIIGNRQDFDRQALEQTIVELHKARHRVKKDRGTVLPATLNPNSHLAN
jgi:hypothetical protein